MRIPNTINPLTIEVYSPSTTSLRLLDEYNRKLRAINFDTYFSAVDTLITICVQTIAKNFEKYPFYTDLLQSDKDFLVELLSTDLPLTLVIPLIDLEHYWKRRYHDHFGEIIQYKYPNWTWKSVYLERHVRKIVQAAEPQYKDELDHDDVLKLCTPYIRMLILKQLQQWSPSRMIISKADIPPKDLYPTYHIDFGPILKHLTNIVYLEICFGMNEQGMDFDKHTFEVDPMDLERLALAIRPLITLICLKVHKSHVKCPHIRKFVRKMLDNDILTELDFSFCKIGDDGGKYIAKLILTMKQLKILNLKGNNIGKDGTHGIGWALQEASSFSKLYTLNLSLNPLGTDGISNLCAALMRCTIPVDLRIRGVGLKGFIAVTFASMLKYNRALKELDLSDNEVNVDAGKNLIVALADNYSLIRVDLRETGLPEEILAEVKSLVARNVDKLQKEMIALPKPRPSYEDSEETEISENMSFMQPA